MYDAIKSYWSWSESYNQYIVYRKSADVARVRFDGIKGSVANGESPPIDTVEALIQLQNMLTQVIKWENEFRNAGLELSVFLWDDQANPLQLNPETVPLMTDSLKINPGGVFTDTISDRLSAIVNRHPDILVTRYKIDTYRIENRLYRDKLKPKLNLSYNLLAKGQGITSEQMQYLYMSQNYKFGAEFVFPLFLRRERGDIRMSNVKINETNYALSWKLLALQNKIQMAINDVKNNFRQLELLDQMVENYKTMLDGEEQRFLSGESSVFLINARQQKLVEAENKMVELKAKYFKSIIALFWSCGTATQIIN
jgi:outer membrane protein TolC